MIIKYLKKIKHDFYFFRRSRKLNKQKSKMLKKLSLFLNNNNITYWLEYGTLLGAIRNKAIIPHDYDVDIGMLQSQWNMNIRHKLKALGFIFIRDISVDNIIYEESYSFNGIVIDFFYCSITDDEIYTPVFRPFNNMTWAESLKNKGGYELYLFKNKYNGLEKTLFENSLWFTPKNYDSHLISYYGNSYMIPSKHWEGENAAIAMGKLGKVSQ